MVCKVNCIRYIWAWELVQQLKKKTLETSSRDNGATTYLYVAKFMELGSKLKVLGIGTRFIWCRKELAI